MATATDWAWATLRSRATTLDTPLRLTLLAFTYRFDQAAAGRDMFDALVLEQAVTGIAPAELCADIGVTTPTVRSYCRRLVSLSLLDEAHGGRFTLTRRVWAHAADTAS